MPKLVPKAEYARMHGKSRAAITQWGARGLLVMQDDLVDVDASNALLGKNRKGGAGALSSSVSVKPSSLTVELGESPETVAANIIATSGVEWSFDEARRVKESYLALLNQLEYDTKARAVVRVDRVAKAFGDACARVRTRLSAIPAEIAPELHRKKTISEIVDELRRSINEALEELTSGGDGTGTDD